MTRSAPISAGEAAEGCEHPAAEGCYGLRPQDLHSAYGLPTTAPTAQTQTIALVDAYNDLSAEKDLKVYDEVFELPACTAVNGCFKEVNQNGETGSPPFPHSAKELKAARKGSTAEREKAERASGWATEISLDIQVAHATCQNCHILLVEAESSSYEDLETAEDHAVTAGATEVSNSWYGEEPITDSGAFEHPGTVITAAAGDYGYLNWDVSEEAAPEEPKRGSVNYPASSPHVVAVGGTRLELSSPSNTWKSETVWNDGSAEGGDGAGGSGCSEHFDAPPWQLKLSNWLSVGCASDRATADISADADPDTGVAVYDTSPDEGGAVQDWETLGGTSLASPLIASAFALAGGAGGVEYPARSLYENEIRDPASLHDVESGSNGECSKPLKEGLSGCTALEEAASCSGHSICVAGPAYSGPAGVGTPNGIGAFQPTGAPLTKAQLIEFTSSAPGSASVGGAIYAVAATASSGLAVSFSSGTPSVCSVTGSTVSFSAVGTCTLDANQAGSSEYEAAPEAQQSFAVGPAPTLLSTPPAASSSTLSFTSSSRPAPNSNFVLGNPAINPKTGTITFTASVGDPGTFSWVLTFANGRFGAFQASKRKCKAGQIKLSGRCRPAKIVFATGNAAVDAAGIASFTVKPSASAAKALRNALKKKQGLSVTATLTFRTSLGASAVSHTLSITDRLKQREMKGKS
jgi:hypothetical protein